MGTIIKQIIWLGEPVKVGEKRDACVRVLEGYNNAYISDFQRMGNIVRRTFPQAMDSRMQVAKIVDDPQMRGFALLRWDSVSIQYRKYRGWTTLHELPDYEFR